MGITINSELYDYPVTIDSDEIYNITGRDLTKIEGDNPNKVANFLNTVHSEIYDYIIYNTGRADIKNRIILKYLSSLSQPIKRALMLQAKYLLENNNIGLWNGAVSTIDGAITLSDSQEIIRKIVSVEAINTLMATQPNILYAGG